MYPNFMSGILVCLTILFATPLYAQKASFKQVPGAIVTYSPASSKKYIGSPSIAILPNGDYVASHDFFGPNSNEHVRATSRIFKSENKGKKWEQIAEIDGAFWSKLFVHKGVLYFLGTDRHHGNTLIRKSTDGGLTWTQPVDKRNGLLREGEFHCAPMPVIEHNGRLWRAMETAYGPIRVWGKRYGAFMFSVPVDADLLNADNWTNSNELLYDSTYLAGNFSAWLEGNAVVTPEGQMVDVLRVDDKTTLEEKAAVVNISADGKHASFDAQSGFIPFKGGSKKFSIRFDPVSKRYITLANAIPDHLKTEYTGKNPAKVRNTLVLMSSADLKDWQVHNTLLSHPDVEKHGFQYIDWQFEGKNIIFLARTAYEDGVGGAHNNHDANFLTFHRIKNFGKKLR